MERDEKGRFVKGSSGNPKTQFRGGLAEDMQVRSVASRKERKTLREALLEALMEEGGDGYTKLEILARKAMSNHVKGKLSFKDLKDLSSVLGEDVLTVKNDGPAMVVVPESAVDAINKWKKKAE